MKTQYVWLLGIYHDDEQYTYPTYVLYNYLRQHLDKDVYLTDQWGIPLKGREDEYYRRTYWDELLKESQ